MKVVCDGCQTKYKLTDGRLSGRNLRFRCRKCGNTIFIEGAEVGQAAGAGSVSYGMPDGFAQEPAPGFEPAGPDWYLSLNGEPYGPCTTEQMASMLEDGQVAWDTYVWRDGYAEWKAASESQTLVRAVSLVAAQGYPRSQGAAAGDSEWTTEAGSGPAPAASGLPAYGYEREDAMFGAPDAPRHDDPTRVAYVDPQTGRASYPAEEVSSLIDIRALSALAGTRRNATAPGAVADSRLEDSVLRTSLFSERMRNLGAFDSMAPVERTRALGSKAVPLAILAGAGLIAMAAFAALNASPVPKAADSPAATRSASDDEHPIAPPSSAAEPAAQRSPAAGQAPDSATAPPRQATPEVLPQLAPATVPSEPAPSRFSDRRGNSKFSAKAAPSLDAVHLPSAPPAPSGSADAPPESASARAPALPAPAEPAAPANAPEKRSAGQRRSIDELLDDAVGSSDDAIESAAPSGASEPHAEPIADAQPARAAGVDLPSTPSREQVLAAMRAIEPDVHACTDGQTLEALTAAAAFTVSGATGRVGNVRVTGIGGPVGACITRAVRSAMFPPFAKSQLRINFPFRLGP